MVLGIRPTVDFAFKQLFGNPEHTSLTVHFLNAVLGESPRITQVTILDPILGRESDDDKLSVLDVLAIDDQGRRFNVEMQTSLSTALTQRLVYYAGCLYVNQLRDGEPYGNLRPVISICVLDKPLFPEVDSMHLDFQLRETNGLALTDHLQIHLVELSKSGAAAHNLGTASALERWAYFLRNAEKLDAEAARHQLPDEAFHEAIGVLEMISRNPEQERLYNARLKFERDAAAKLDYALTQGRERGYVEGKAEGNAVGERIGQIHVFQRLLGLPQTPSNELIKLGLDELAAMIAELESQFTNRQK